MKYFPIATAAASILMLSACSDGPEVVVTEDLGNEEARISSDATILDEPVAATWDTNNDGILQKDEYTAWHQRGISAWDTNSDNRLSLQEFSAGWIDAGFKDADTIFALWDDNVDQYLTDDEFFDDEEWPNWDTNSNGALEPTEFGYG